MISDFARLAVKSSCDLAAGKRLSMIWNTHLTACRTRQLFIDPSAKPTMHLATKNWPPSTINMQIKRSALKQVLEIPTQDYIGSLVGLLKPTMRSICLTVIVVCGFCAQSIAELQ